MSVVHGRSGYNYHGCRCQVCTKANREYMAEFRARKSGTLAPGDPRHGKVSTYVNYSCRCPACGLVWSSYLKAHRRRAKP